MTQPQIVYELTFVEDPYESPLGYGTYATQALAEAMRDAVLAVWEQTEHSPLSVERCRIRPIEVWLEIPTLHCWQATIPLDDENAQPDVQRIQPRIHATEPTWFHFEDPARFVQCPMQWVAGSGPTPEAALEAMRKHHAKALSLGALEILSTTKRLAAEAEAESQRRAAAAEPNEWGYKPEPWTYYTQALHDLALAHWGPGPYSDR
jgi:hypothetical protein